MEARVVQLESLEDFRARIRAAVGVIVIDDVARPEPIAHGTDCVFVTEESFRTKILDGQGHNGAYYWAPSVAVARDELNARPCRSPADSIVGGTGRRTVGPVATHVRPTSDEVELLGPLPELRAVEAWADAYLPYEPKTEAAALLRGELRERLRRLVPVNDEVLQAAYAGPKPRNCDVENLLLYNVDDTGGCFARAAAKGVRFELATRALRKPPSGRDRSAAYQYRFVPRSKGPYFHWRVADVVAAWAEVAFDSGPQPDRARSWLALRTAPVELGEARTDGARFAVQLTVSPPAGSPANPARLVKPLLDAAVAALQIQAGPLPEPDVLARFAAHIGVESEEATAYLTSTDRAVLGGADRLLWKWGKTFQVNPSDNDCVAGEVLLAESCGREWTVTGEIAVVEAR